ncbi:MAG: hypothetical protein QF752_11470 [Planctomycetota bacterium]|nr:hypothetical protein [Planctomycetota bacterium]
MIQTKHIVTLLLLANVALLAVGSAQEPFDAYLAGSAAGLALLTVIFWLFGTHRSHLSSPEVAGSTLELIPPAEGGALGEEMTIEAKLTPSRTLQLNYLILHLVNKQLEKKPPLDKVVRHSTFIFRKNIHREIRSGQPNSESIRIKVPACREPTRESKYVSITWEITPEAHFSAPEGSRQASYVYRGTPTSIPVAPPEES